MTSPMRIIFAAILLTACALLSAVNHLDVVWQMQGEQSGDYFGYYVTALDFNGDEIDDLAVSAWRHSNDVEYPEQHGKLYIYYGSENGLPDEPSMQISTVVDTSLDWQYSWMRIKKPRRHE